jgi:hypothetical protein
MNRYIGIDKRNIIIEVDRYRYFKVTIPRRYNIGITFDCYNCVVTESTLSNTYCNSLKIQDRSSSLCDSLNNIGYLNNFIEGIKPLKTSIFMISLIRNKISRVRS